MPAAVAALAELDHALAKRLYAVATATAPVLSPKTWYGMVLCFFTAARKLGTRYAPLGFNDDAHLDDGAMWPTSFALTELTPAAEARIAALVKQAVS